MNISKCKNIQLICVLAVFCALPSAFGQQAPWGRPDIPISAHGPVYAANQTSNTVSVIDPSTNKLLGVIRLGDPVPGALSPLYTGQLLVPGALVYGPNAVPNGPGTDNLVPLGEAGNTARLRLNGGGTAMPDAGGWVAVNSFGLLDLVQIAAEGLTPKLQYQVYLTESDHAPFGKLEPLAVLKTNPDGAEIVQSIGPLKALAGGPAPGAAAGASLHRFLIVSDVKDPSRVVLRQASTLIAP